MAQRAGKGTTVHRRLAVTVTSLSVVVGLALATGCSGDSDSKGTDAPLATLETPDYTLGPTTTFMPDCVTMPTPADLSTAAGIPLADGIVIATGTCEFRGLNDQARVVTLGLLTDPADQASFNDFIASVGASTPLNDPTVEGALLGPDSTVYVVTDHGIYTVQTNVTDAPMADQTAVSLKILAKWLTA